MDNITTIFLLLVAFQLKHFIADYPLQNQYMLGKMKVTGWIQPLAAHTTVHACFTAIIVLWFCILSDQHTLAVVLAPTLALADFVIHFTVDRIKASPKLGGSFTPTQPYFWWALGADQMAHHLTHYVFIYILISNL